MGKPGFFERLRRHIRLSLVARGGGTAASPPFLILFINSICNLTCEHCFYWRNLNRRDDLSFDEIARLSSDLGPIENLNLSGGEPFLRPDFAEIVSLFVRNNGVRQVYVPTNAYFTERTRVALERVLEESMQLFACEISLDGMPEYHDRFRGNPKSFAKAMETYDMLAELQREDPRLRIHAVSTVTHENVGEIRRLTDHLYERCPAMDHHNIAVIRGDRKNPSLKGPALDEYRELWEHVRSRWSDREEGRLGAIVEPLLQWTKLETLAAERQVVSCRAGILSAVVYSNGDVSVCETHPPLGNLRRSSFREIWHSTGARELRERIADRECWCTNEVFMWPSIVFQPGPLLKASLGARIWKKPKPAAAP
jgi:MoaA/NifB/PqqE/SkfB family radical SAM enzyme